MSDDSADQTSSGSASGIIFRKSISPMDVLDASRSRPDVFSKLYCGYSTPARSGICCRKGIATFVMAKGGGAEIGPTKRGKGMKIMAIVDRHGLPLSVSTHAANHHEVRLVQLCFDFYMIEA